MSYYRERETISPINKVKVHRPPARPHLPLQPSSYHSALPNKVDTRHVEILHTATASNSKDLLVKFEVILKDKETYRKLLQAEGEEAQQLIDTLQTLLEYPNLKPASKSMLLKALLRVSNKTGLYPTTLVLKGVEREEEPVTAGHFGEIWKGKHGRQTMCLKVVKVYKTSQIARVEQAFRKEALIWAHLHHPNLLPFYGMYRLPDSRERLCLVSPWMDNGNVTEYLKKNPDVDRFLLIDDIAKGLSYLHESHIVHGDLKGANILISPAGRACLGDFGLSGVLDSEFLKWTSLQSTAQAGGTIRWQAPELFTIDESQEAKISKATDMYAFACVCYEVFTGKVPFFEVAYDAAVILKVINGERPSRPVTGPMNALAAHIHKDWDFMWKLMTKCWESTPSEPLRAGDIVKHLADFNTYEPKLAESWGHGSPTRFRHGLHAEEL